MMSAGWDPGEAGLGSCGGDVQRTRCKAGEDWFIDPSEVAKLPSSFEEGGISLSGKRALTGRVSNTGNYIGSWEWLPMR